MSELMTFRNPFSLVDMRGKDWIQSKLDKGFVNNFWLSLFQAYNQVFLDKYGSYQSMFSSL